MAKLTLSYSDFLLQVNGVAPTFNQDDAIFFVKTGAGGKIELNRNSGTWTVGSGSKFLPEITQAVKSAGFNVVKENRGWTILEFTTVTQFDGLYKTVTQAVAGHSSPKTVKLSTIVKKVNKEFAKKKAAQAKAELNVDEIAVIKAKNLATIKAVSSKLKNREYLDGQISKEQPGEKVSKEEMARRKADIDSFVNYETDELPSFRAPGKITKDELKAIV